MGRMIHAVMWEDEFFTSMPVFDRLLWIGLITVCADDQGRMQDSPAMVRSKVFPVDDIPISQIAESLNRVSVDGKILRYVSGKHKCIQIVNWWRHQKPQWAARSIYPAYSGWVDRVRYHITKKEIYSLNWDKAGGLPNDLVEDQLPQDVKYESDVKYEDEIKGEDECVSPVQHLIESVFGIPPASQSDLKALDEIELLSPSREDVQEAYAWLMGVGKKVKYYSQLVGPIRTAMSKHAQKPIPITTLEKSKAAILEAMAEMEAE